MDPVEIQVQVDRRQHDLRMPHKSLGMVAVITKLVEWNINRPGYYYTCMKVRDVQTSRYPREIPSRSGTLIQTPGAAEEDAIFGG